MPLVELVDLCLAVFATEAYLMPPEAPGKGLVQVAGDVVAAFRWGLADDFEAADVDIGRVRIRRVGNEAERVHIETGLLVIEYLVEVVHTDVDLVGHV